MLNSTTRTTVIKIIVDLRGLVNKYICTMHIHKIKYSKVGYVEYAMYMTLIPHPVWKPMYIYGLDTIKCNKSIAKSIGTLIFHQLKCWKSGQFTCKIETRNKNSTNKSALFEQSPFYLRHELYVCKFCAYAYIFGYLWEHFIDLLSRFQQLCYLHSWPKPHRTFYWIHYHFQHDSIIYIYGAVARGHLVFVCVIFHFTVSFCSEIQTKLYENHLLLLFIVIALPLYTILLW